MKRRFWTESEIATLRELFPDNYAKDVAAALNRTEKAVHQQANLLGLKKSDGFRAMEHARQSALLRTTGINSRFQKGLIPANKGQKMPDELRRKVSRTFFPKGSEGPRTAKHGDRSLSLRKDKSGTTYWHIRVKKNVWIPFSQYVWITFNGDIPAGHIVAFRDGNTMNVHPDNLMLITRQKNARRNHNPQKAANTIKTGQASDRYYASRMFMKDRTARELALKHAPELIEAKRLQTILKHKLNQTP